MTSAIATIREVVGITEVAHVDVTEIVADPAGGYVREVRIYGNPDGTDAPPVVTLRLAAPARAALEVQTPEMAF